VGQRGLCWKVLGLCFNLLLNESRI